MKLINKKQAGFTLIELIIVIVILGILAVTAAPKFLDLQGDATESTLSGVKGAIASSMNIVYGKAIINGENNKVSGSITPPGGTAIATVWGHPAATRAAIIAATDISLVATTSDTTGGDFDFTEATGTIHIYPIGGSSTGTCHILYTQSSTTGSGASAALNVTATVTSVTTGC